MLALSLELRLYHTSIVSPPKSLDFHRLTQLFLILKTSTQAKLNAKSAQLILFGMKKAQMVSLKLSSVEMPCIESQRHP
jgi:hypothetical protein